MTVSPKIRRVLMWTGPICVFLLLYGGWTLWEASRTLDESARKVRASLDVQSLRLSRVNTAAEAIGATSGFRDAVAWRGRFYLCGSAGLFVYTPDGALEKSYLVGVDLPPAPLVALRAAQDLWIATAGEGALIFDGNAFRQVLPGQRAHRILTSILPLATGRVLLGSEKAGVLVYDGAKLDRLHASLDGVHVTALEGDDNDVWIGTLDRGILHTHGGQIDTIGDLPDKHVLSIAASGGRAWVGTALGVAEVDAGRIRRTIGSGTFAKALHHSNGKLWIGTLDGDVLEISTEGDRTRPSPVNSEPLNEEISRFLEVDDQILALTPHRLQSGARKILESSPGALTDGNIAALSVDPAGRLWVGYFDRGLDVLTGVRAQHFENDRVFCVNRIAHDPERGLTAVATANGLVLFDAEPKQKQVLTRDDGLIANHVTDVSVLPAGGMALATAAGVSFVDASGVRSLYAFHGLVNNHAYALAAAGPRVYVGTLGGLSMLEGGVVQANYTTANSPLKANWISAVAAAGDEWYVGTYGAGVVRIGAHGTWSSYSDFPAKLEINPNAMAVSSTRVYAGSLGDGLWVLDRTTQRWGQITRGLPSRNVTAISVHNGTVYVGTDNGLVKMNEGRI